MRSIMTGTGDGDLLIREATEEDIEGVGDLFRIAYGDDYAFPQYYEPRFLKTLVFNNDCLMLVAENTKTGQILGTASVVFDVGAFTDLVGEFGRLVVHPDGRGQGIGKKLMLERLARVGEHLHVGLADNRVAHPFSQKISLRHGFRPVGYLPIHNGEPVALFAQHFNDSLSLRRNHPRIAPGIDWLANLACENIGFDCDAIIDDTSASYPDAYVILDGEAEVVIQSGGGGGLLGCGDFIGELSLLNHLPHSAGVRALSGVRAAVIDHLDLEDLLHKRGDIGIILYRNLARGLGEKLRRKDSH